MILIGKAIQSLRPNTEWTLNGDDVENIIWHTQNVEPLTSAEVETELNRLKQEEENKKQTATAKLIALGLTADDLKALGL
jgi:hypothetical protein